MHSSAGIPRKPPNNGELYRRGRRNRGTLLGDFVRMAVLLFGAMVAAAIVLPSVKPKTYSPP